MKWEKVNATGERPGKRWGHTCSAVKGGKLLYLFGGYGKFNCQTNQVHVYDTVKQSWSQPEMKGLLPIARDSHSSAVIGDNLFVFGGTDGTNLLRDLHILDTNSHTWISPSVRGEGPEAREGHSAAVVGKRIFIFGGVGKSADRINEVYYNDLYILNTETFVWSRATTSGTPPSPRDSHSSTSWKNKIIVIGGEDDRGDYLSDIHILDTDTLIWKEQRTSGQLLPPRAGHSAIAIGKNLFVFGGFTEAQTLYNDLYMLDIENGAWTKVMTTPNGPSARFAVAGDCLDPFLGGVLVYIGGCNRSLEALDDMYYLYTGLARESEQRPEKLSLRKQLKMKCQEQNLNLVENPVLCGYEMGADRSLPMPMAIVNYSQPSRVNPSLLPPGKHVFQAKVIQRKEAGYSIETAIDGKILRGFVFSNKPNTINPVPKASSRKRTASDIDSVVSSERHPSKVLKLDRMEDRGKSQQGDSSQSHEHHREADATVILSTPTTAAETIQASVNQEANVVSLNQNTDEKNDTPKSLDENLKNDGAKDLTSAEGEIHTNDQTNVPISNFEAPRLAEHGQVSDAPDCNIDVQKSVVESLKNDASSSKGDNVQTSNQTNVPVSNDEVPRPEEHGQVSDALNYNTDLLKSLVKNLKNDGAKDVTSSKDEVQNDDQTNMPISNYEAPRMAEHGQVSDAPNYNIDLLKSLAKNLKNDGANDVSSSKDEVQTDDQTNVQISNYDAPRMAEHGQVSDAPYCDTDVLKPTVTESAVSPSNQGVLGDCTSPRKEGQSEPAKST